MIPPNPTEFYGHTVVDSLHNNEKTSLVCLLVTTKVSTECDYRPIGKPWKCLVFEKHHPGLFSSVKSIRVLAQSWIYYDLLNYFSSERL